MEVSGAVGCPYSAFTKNPKGVLKIYNYLDDSLKILVARGIIKMAPGISTSEEVYTFCTVFYYYAILGQMDSHIEDRLFTRTTDEDIEKENAKKVVEDYCALSDVEQDMALGGIMARSKNKNFQSNNYYYYNEGDVVNGSKNVIYNIQNITNTFATLLTGNVSDPKFLEALGKLPKLTQFIPGEGDSYEKLTSRIGELQYIDDEEELQEAYSEIEHETLPAENSMVGTTVAAATASSSFYNVTDQNWIDLIHVSRDELSKQLPSEIVTSLSFAVMLHNVFHAIWKKAETGGEGVKEKAKKELDYCPVAIMYCKVAEALLKKLHTPIYAERLGERSYKGFNGPKFSDLKKEDGSVDVDNDDLTIGSFCCHIVQSKNKKQSESKDQSDSEELSVDNPDVFKAEVEENVKAYSIKRITNIQDYTLDRDPINRAWKDHAIDLAIIREIRNKSAHKLQPVTKANFDFLIQTLFEDGELLRIASLSRIKYPW